MGILVATDTGNTAIRSSSGLVEPFNDSVDGITNPSDQSKYPEQYGLINLKGYTLTDSIGKNVDAKDTIAGTFAKLSMGSKKPIPITLTAKFKNDKVTLPQTPTGTEGARFGSAEMNSVAYLKTWGRSRSIIMLFYVPDDDSDTNLNYGQVSDFYNSNLRSLYDSLWDKNLGNENLGWNDATYGSIRFLIQISFAYQACAIPIIINNVTTKETAGKKFTEVSVTGFMVVNEE